MRSTILRSVLAPLALAAAALVVSDAQAATPPPVSCQTMAPHHVLKLPSTEFNVSTTSSLAYWDNACGCYVVTLEVPASTGGGNSHWETNTFTIGASSEVGGLTKEQCEAWREDTFVYKKEANGNLALIHNTDGRASWLARGVFGNGGPATCAFSAGSGPAKFYAPPATGTDTYRILRRITGVEPSHRAVTVSANHPAIIH